MIKRIFSTLAFAVGLLACWASWSVSLMLLCGLATLALWHPALRRRQSQALFLLALLTGAGRAALDRALECSPAALKDGGYVVVSGTVLESPRAWGGSQVFFLTVSEVDDASLASPATLLVRWSGSEDVVAPGERWEFSGRFTRGELATYPGGYSQRHWLWTQRAEGALRVSRFSDVRYLGPAVGWGPRAQAARLRELMLSRLEKIKEPSARALIAGVVFGDTQALPKDIQDQFRRTGTSHLLAASGMNVALLIGLFAAAARLCGIGPWRIAPALIPLAIGYAFLAGCAPSITRAAAAAVMGLLATWLGRKSGSWNSLCLSIWILLLWEPRQIYDVGFQLSVAAVIGLIAGPSLDEAAAAWKKNSLMTLSACMLTLPIMWTMFGEISLTLLPANLILGPLVETLFPLGLLLTVVPLAPLYSLTEAIARISLFLVKILSALADPVPLAQPAPSGLLVLAVAIAIWVGVWTTARWWALPIAVAVLAWGQLSGLRPYAGAGELVIRQVGKDKPYYWLSSDREELLVLSEAWQEKRAKAMLLDLGCLRRPAIKTLPAGQAFTVRWGAFRWGKVSPLLPKAAYLEVRTTGCTYVARSWRPDED